MNILYFSVHQILEDDEVRLFQRLGHSVVCLGSNGPNGTVHEFRPALKFSPIEHQLYQDFLGLGGKFSYGATTESIVIPKAFMEKIDVTIVMHDATFIVNFWDILCSKPVVWRTIGQGIEALDDMLRPYRARGLLIVRYSPVEQTYEKGLGQEAVIRFGKSSETYTAWRGDEQQVLTFSNLFAHRYPDDFLDYCRIVDRLPAKLGGSGNDGIPNAIGTVSWDDQIKLTKTSAVYLYASGAHIPYTLNFIEAWMCGIPVVVYSPVERQGKYFEIDRLIVDGLNGFICRTVSEARSTITQLLSDSLLRQRVGKEGRESACKLFSEVAIERKWSAFLGTISLYLLPSALSSRRGRSMISDSKRVFDTISLLRPFDIDIAKVHIGNERDGGYILADNFSCSNDIISFGVGPDVTFEMEMARRGHRVFLHDHTVDAPGQDHPRFKFRQVGVSSPDNKSSDLMTLDECLATAGNLSDRLLLKMDIEGHEWDVFSNVSDITLERFDQIAMEVHWLENLSSAEFDRKVSASLQAINRQFTLFHVHANNCAGVSVVCGHTVASVLELSFVRTSLITRKPSKTVYPTSLNKSNHPAYPDHPLLFYPFIPTDVEPDRFDEVVTRIDLQS